MDVREKLAGHLYRSALALAPQPIPVARLTHPSGVTWELGGGMIAVTIDGVTQTIAANGSVEDLLNDLSSLFGVTTSFVDPDLLQVPAGALLCGWGSSASSSEDALQLFTTSLWALLDAYGAELGEADANLVEALDQLYMDTADGEILDVWGEYFGVPRKDSEVDPDYYARIVREVLRPRVNRFAIEAAIFDDTGLLVSLREPHREIFRLSISPLSGNHHLQDGRFYTWNVFQPVYHSSMTLAQRDRILEIIERNRPAGCLIVEPTSQPPIGYAEGSFGQSLSSQITLVNNFGFMNFQPGLLSATLFLSNQRDLVSTQFHWSTFGEVALAFGTENSLPLFDQRVWDDGVWDEDVWIRPSVFSVVTQHPA